MSVVLRNGVTWRLAAKCSSLSSVRRGLSNNAYNEGWSKDEPRQKVALVIGSSGCLGSTIVQHLVNDMAIRVVGADIVGPREGSTTLSNSFIQLPTSSQPAAFADVTAALVQGLSDILGEEDKIDAIICASGGWVGDPSFPKPDATDEEFMKGAQEYGDTVNKMLEMNLYPVLAAGYVANRFMANKGLFVAIGATVALSATPGMFAYGLSKVGAHHFVQSLGGTTGKATTTRSNRQKARRLRKNSEYLDDLSVVGILPTTIDTPSNRKAMPEGDFDDWTKPEDIAKEIGYWIAKPPMRPHSGCLMRVVPAKDRGGAMFSIAR